MFFIYLFNFFGQLYHIQGQSSIITVSSKFVNGDLKLTWNFSTSLSSPFVWISDKERNWIDVYDTEYTVKKVLSYKFIYIDVIDKLNALTKDGFEWSYEVLKIKQKSGKSAKLQWTASYFPTAGQNTVFHMLKSNHPIIHISSTDVLYQGQQNQSSKYVYLSKPHNSVNISFEIRNITLDDAGYYNSGLSTDDAQSGGGVVLIVYGKPLKPQILGNRSSLVGSIIELTCSSQSTSAPDYYSKLVTLSYTWFQNETIVNRETKKRLIVTRAEKYNKYSCTATEEDLESDRSDPVQINPLYGPEMLNIVPRMPDNFINEGDVFGPYNCSVDCIPPCVVSWDSNKSVGIKTQGGYLQPQIVNRNLTLVKCAAKWGTNISKEIVFRLNIHYLDRPRLYINDSQANVIFETYEHTMFHLRCFVNGNPVPTIKLTQGSKEIRNQKTGKWLNETIQASCSNTDTYTCSGSLDGLNSSEQMVKVNVKCNPRIDTSVSTFQNNYASTSGKNVKVLIPLPVIANPAPQVSDITWTGPTRESVKSVVYQRGAIYKHWINTTVGVYDHSYFGNYTLKHKNETLVTITIHAQDRPQVPLNFTGYSDAVGNVNLTWMSGFNGGLEQVFIVSIRSDFGWKNIANLTDPGEGKVVYFETKHLNPGQTVWYRVESCNEINCSIQPAEIEIHVKELSTGLLMGLNKVTFVAIGSSVSLFILSVILIIVLVRYFLRKSKRKCHNDETECEVSQQGAEKNAVVDKNEPTKNRKKDTAETSGARGDKNGLNRESASEMYAAVDKSLLKENTTKAVVLVNDNTHEKDVDVQHGTEMYAVVNKSLLKKGGESNPRTNVVTEKKCKGKTKEKNGSLQENNESPAGSRRTNDEGLIYIDVDFTNKPESSDTNQKPVIHGEEDRTEYTFVDFSKKAPSPPETNDKEGK